MKPDIVLASRPFPAIEEALAREFTCHRLYDAPDRQALLAAVGPKARGLLCFSGTRIDAALLDALPRLEIISNMGVGVDSIDLEAARRRGVVVTNTPDVVTECTADTALGLILNLLRQFPRAEAYLRAGKWATQGAYPLSAAIGGKTLGVLGLGRIGRAIARRAQAFGMAVRYHNRRPADAPFPYDPDPVSLAANADVLVVAIPGGPETQQLVGAQVLDALGPRGYLINIARGSVVDEPVLVRYLQERRIAGAGLDVYANEPHVPAELIALDNVVLLPHVGTATVKTRTAMANLQLENLRLHFAGQPVRTPVA
jgi:lactate dehydrogenase-like 2-hydroxyacid dehydrogenase